MANWQFPDGKTVAVVTSWDDGAATDQMMLRMLEQYGYKGTFYVCPESLGTEGFLDAAALHQIAAAGHEIGSHSLSHPHLETLTAAECHRQIVESKVQLEALIGAAVTSFAYPYGFAQGPQWIADTVRAAGYASARTTQIAELLTAADLAAGDPMRLLVTAYFTESFPEIQAKWQKVEEVEGGIFHLWGCSRELGMDPNDWVDFECNLGYLGGISHVWYCTVGELIAAVRAPADER
ncbi:MAG TPA: polysaccharide deacetylase family protein [Chthonomonadaceae bacterium]|nr:polysaccharide deacetylase family protein [Chthonomonadaceae bacterium]